MVLKGFAHADPATFGGCVVRSGEGDDEEDAAAPPAALGPATAGELASACEGVGAVVEAVAAGVEGALSAASLLPSATDALPAGMNLTDLFLIPLDAFIESPVPVAVDPTAPPLVPALGALAVLCASGSQALLGAPLQPPMADPKKISGWPPSLGNASMLPKA